MAKPKNVAAAETATQTETPTTTASSSPVASAPAAPVKTDGAKAAAVKPSVGRIVLYTPNRAAAEGHAHVVFAAIVTRVAKDGTLSLTVFSGNGVDHVHGVHLVDEAKAGACTWPPRV